MSQDDPQEKDGMVRSTGEKTAAADDQALRRAAAAFDPAHTGGDITVRTPITPSRPPRKKPPEGPHH